MTAALLRVCNNCKKPFLKDYGCNKMKCPCGNSQCYVCSKNVNGYDHFGEDRCQLYEDMEERLRIEVAEAQKQAVQQVLEKRNDLTEEDIRVDKDVTAKRHDKTHSRVHRVRAPEDRARLRNHGDHLERRLHLMARQDEERRREERRRDGERRRDEENRELEYRRRHQRALELDRVNALQRETAERLALLQRARKIKLAAKRKEQEQRLAELQKARKAPLEKQRRERMDTIEAWRTPVEREPPAWPRIERTPKPENGKKAPLGREIEERLAMGGLNHRRRASFTPTPPSSTPQSPHRRRTPSRH
jgi:hypothetical protein